MAVFGICLNPLKSHSQGMQTHAFKLIKAK